MSYQFGGKLFITAPRMISAPRMVSAPTLRQTLKLPGAMALTRANMSGPGYMGPRISQNNPIATKFYNNVNATANRSGTNRFGPWIPTMDVNGLNSFRSWYNTATNAYDRDIKQRFAMMTAQGDQPPKIVFRNTGGSSGGFRNFGQVFGIGSSNNQGWKYQNTSGQKSKSSYKSGNSKGYFVNSSANAGFNRMS